MLSFLDSYTCTYTDLGSCSWGVKPLLILVIWDSMFYAQSIQAVASVDCCSPALGYSLSTLGTGSNPGWATSYRYSWLIAEHSKQMVKNSTIRFLQKIHVHFGESIFLPPTIINTKHTNKTYYYQGQKELVMCVLLHVCKIHPLVYVKNWKINCMENGSTAATPVSLRTGPTLWSKRVTLHTFWLLFPTLSPWFCPCL